MSGATRITVRVIANSHRPGLVSLDGKVLHCKVGSPPVDGRANRELCELLAQILGLPQSAVVVRFGHLARQKVVELAGIDEGKVFAILRQVLSSQLSGK